MADEKSTPAKASPQPERWKMNASCSATAAFLPIECVTIFVLDQAMADDLKRVMPKRETGALREPILPEHIANKPKPKAEAPSPILDDKAAKAFAAEAQANPATAADGSLLLMKVLRHGLNALGRPGLVQVDHAAYGRNIVAFRMAMGRVINADMPPATRAAITLAVESAFLIGAQADMLPELAPQRKQQEWNERGDVARAGKKFVAVTVRAPLYAEIRRLADIFRAENPQARGKKVDVARAIRPAVRAYIVQLEAVPGGWELADEGDSKQVANEIGRISKHV